MRLKRVEIAGFKSFMDRTSLTIEPGVTAIVGPNGCGKSNIVDAIRWAMGEASAKALRGHGMEDVIFHGTDSYQPVGMAEVTLTFENLNGHAPAHLAGCSEIEVTRRLFRSGESEYCINRVPCRRRDIWELFMDTGLGNRSYAIVEQDRVSRIISARPEERRVVVEEVAGISRYKSRREAAQRKIEATRQNLQRIQDIRHEVGQQIQGLERQARKAERYKSLKAELLELERGIVIRKWALLDQERSALEEQIGSLGRQRDEVASEIQAEELVIQKERMVLLELERKVLEGQEGLHRKETALRDLENQIQRHTEELRSMEISGNSLEQEIQGLEGRLDLAQNELKSRGIQREELRAQLEKGQVLLEELRGQLQRNTERARLLRARLEEARVELVEWMGDRARLRNALQHYRRRAEGLEQTIQRGKVEENELERQLAELTQATSSMEQELQELQGALGQLQSRKGMVQEELAGLLAEREGIRARVQSLVSGIQEIRSRIQALEGLQRELAGFSEGVRALREAAQKGEVRLGPAPLRAVAEVMDVAEGAESMVAGLLGERLQYLIVENWEQALEGLAYVRERGLGRVGFVALGQGLARVQGEKEAQEEGFRIQWDPGYEALGEILLAETQVVDDPRNVLRGWPLAGARRLVTMAGDVLEAQGLLEAGERRDPSQGYLARRRELRELRARLGELEAERNRHLELEEGLSTRISALSSEADCLVQGLHQKELRLAECRRDLRSAQEAVTGVRQRLEALRWQLREQVKELDSLRWAEQEDFSRLQELEARIGQRDEELQRLEKEHGAASARLDEVRSEMTQAQVLVASLEERSQSLSREIQGLEKLVAEIQQERSKKEAQREQGLQRSEQIGRLLSQARQELEGLLAEHEDARVRLDEARRGLQEGRAEIQERERAQQGRRQRLRVVEAELQELGLRHRETVLRMEHAQGELQGRLEMAPEDIPVAAARGDWGEPHQQEQRIASLREALERLGDVNLVAVEQYQALKERYDGLSAQQEDLETSIRSLQKAIQRIDRSSRKRFREAFERLDAEFRRVFPILFEGGEAHLVLTSAEDVLDAGLEIVARPPGKRLQSISLLSGGEKALTAVALIFAMITIKETPFCLFDEVDAPLDDANIDRFNRMVRELSRRSQFILVTHSKRTMEIADVLYGVTMESPGISKMISVRLQ